MVTATDRGCLARARGHVVTIARLLTGPRLLLTSPASPLTSLVTPAIGGAACTLAHITGAGSLAIRGAGRTLSPAIISSPRVQVGGVSPLLLLSGVLGSSLVILVIIRILAVVIVVLIVPRHHLRFHCVFIFYNFLKEFNAT